MSAIFWAINRAIYDPPGTPAEVRCIGCKIAAGSLTLGSAGFCVYGAKKYYKTNLPGAFSFALVAVCLIGASAVSFRLANDDHQYNQRLEANYKEQLRRQRRSNNAVNQSSSIEHVS